MDIHSFNTLLEKYQHGTATAAEKALVEAYYRRLETGGATNLSAEEEAALKEALYKKITNEIAISQAKVVPLQPRPYRFIAAAAAVLLVLGAGSYWLLTNKPGTVTANKEQVAVAVKDIPPGRDAAVLTLADGRKIILDSASGTISQQGNATLLNVHGQLSYAPGSATSNASEVVYNTVTTARGNQYQLVLADGTRVWLNSASSLRFPASFTGKRRDVELDGEGYFEVAKNAAMPFHVKTRTQDLEVLGTHFNVNGYKDEDDIKTTLLEGKVKVEQSASDSYRAVTGTAILKPGEQAVLTHDARLTVHDDIDIDQVMAWKNGWFEFDNTDLQVIMRQISRWYDVDIVYETKTGKKFGGRISKNVNLSNLLKTLETYGVHCRLEGKTLIVL
jgi:ferric-dicitrate binding protein FerR (iron transport regulator)